MKRPNLVASDVDGTLLDPLARVTERTARAVASVIASETPFVLVSGRPPRWIPPVAEATKLTGYAVCGNGAVVYHIESDRVVSECTLDPLLLSDVTHTLQHAMPGIAVAAERAATLTDGIASFATEPDFRNPWGPGSDEQMAPRAEVLGHHATKLLVRHGGMTSEEMLEAATEVLDHNVAVTFSTNHGLIEIAAAGVTKAHGLAEVAGLHGLDADDVVAFGDMPNDVAMLHWVGHGVAMANAHPHALEAADEVTAPNSEDGVAQVLERWF